MHRWRGERLDSRRFRRKRRACFRTDSAGLVDRFGPSLLGCRSHIGSAAAVAVGTRDRCRRTRCRLLAEEGSKCCLDTAAGLRMLHFAVVEAGSRSVADCTEHLGDLDHNTDRRSLGDRRTLDYHALRRSYQLNSTLETPQYSLAAFRPCLWPISWAAVAATPAAAPASAKSLSRCRDLLRCR